jgi:hypothetical protein
MKLSELETNTGSNLPRSDNKPDQKVQGSDGRVYQYTFTQAGKPKKYKEKIMEISINTARIFDEVDFFNSQKGSNPNTLRARL